MTHLRRFQHVLRALPVAAFALSPGQASGQTAPTNFAAATDANVHNTINLSWTAEATQTYKIEWVVQTAAAHPGWSGATEIDVSGAGTSTYKHTGLQSAQVYWYRIKACSDATTCTDYPTATTAGGLVARASTGTAPRPSNFAAAPRAGSHTEITLTWTGLATQVYEVQWVEGATLASWPSANASNVLEIPQGSAAAHTYTHTGRKQGTKYWYRIRVCDPSPVRCIDWSALDAVTGSHVASATTTVPAAPTAPTDFAAARDANVHNTINLSWTAEATQTYRIEWVNAFGNVQHPGWSGATEITLAAGTDGYKHTGLRSNHTHWYRIKACNDAGTCTDYPTATAATDPQVATALTGSPPSPTGFGAAPKSGSHTEIALTWTGLATQTYEIHWVEGATLTSWPEATAGKVLQIPQGSAAAHTYTHTGLKQGTKYWYRIRVCDPGHIGCMGWAALNAVTGNHVASATTTAPNVPADPTNFAAATTTNATHSTITLSWTGVAEQSYKVQWTTGTTPTWPALGTNELEIDQDAAAHSYEHAGRDASTQYWYRIRACNASFADCKDYPTATTAGGLVQTATTDAAPTNQLPKPTGLSAQTRLAASGGVSVQWRQRTGTASWQIRWNTSGWDQQYPTANTLTSTYPTGTDIKAPRLTPGVGYYFQVRALTGTGSETASDWADVRGLQNQIRTAVVAGGKLGAITGFTAAAGTAETGKYGIVLTWDEHVGAEAFTVERSPNGTDSWETLTGTVSLDQGSHGYRDNDVIPGATHHYRVTATHTHTRVSNSDPSAVRQATAPSVPDPTGLTATANGTTQIDLTWNGRTADQHKINFGTETGANWDIRSTNVVTVPAGQLTYSHKTLTPGTTYYYRIIACVVGEGEVCSTWPANTADVTVEGDMASAATQLAAPANFVATGVSGGVDLTWDAVAGVTYNLQWRESDAGAWKSLADTTGGSYRHTGLADETAYYYQIRAGSSATSTNPSDWVGGDATTLPPPTPTAPTNFAAAAKSGVHNTITLSWDAESALTYRIEWVEGVTHPGWSGAAEIAVSGAGTDEYDHTGLSSASVYWYRIKACSDATTCSDYPTATTAGGLVATATTGNAPRPSNFAAAPKAGSHTEITLTWTGLATQVYQVQWVEGATLASWPEATAGNTLQIPQGSAAAHTYTHTGLKQGTKYWYRITVCDPDLARCLDWSALDAVTGSHVASATTTAPSVPADPTNFAAATTTNATHSTITLSWTGVAEQSYKVQWTTGTTPTWPALGTNELEIDQDAAAHSYEHAGRDASTQYWYRIRACNASFADCKDYPTATTAGGLVQTATTDAAPTNQLAAPAVTVAFGGQNGDDRSSVSLSWAPVGDATDYAVQRQVGTSGWSQAPGKLDTQDPAEVSYLETAANLGDTTQTHHYRVKATAPNFTDSEWWVGSQSWNLVSTPVDPPTAVQGFTATAGTESVTLSWTAYTGAGTKLEIDYNTTGADAGTWTRIQAEIRKSATSYKHTGLTAGTTYWYRIRAVGDSRQGPWSRALSAKPAAAPTGDTTQVRSLTATGGSKQIVLSWTRPRGSHAIDHYEIEWKASGGSYSRLASTTATTYTNTGLSDGESRTYRVAAVSTANLRGTWSAEASATTTAGPAEPQLPGAPRDVRARADTSSIRVTWDAPEDTGSAAISNYIIDSSSDGVSWSLLLEVGNVTEYTHAGLSPAQTVHYRVRAKNSVGPGPWSASASATVTGSAASSAPGAPRDVRARAGTRGITVTWDAPKDTGSAAITGYIIDSSSDGVSWSLLLELGNETEYTHAGLSPAQTVHYRVRARNSVGPGPWSASTSATVQGRAPSAPGAPLNLVATVTDRTVQLTWQQPADTGTATITAYRIEVSTNGGTNWASLSSVSGTTTLFTHMGAMAGRQYHYRVVATNSVGDGPPSNIAMVRIAADPPSQPRNLTVRPAPRSAVLTWTAPADDGGGDITGYRVEMQHLGAWATLVSSTGPGSTTYTATGLQPGANVAFRVFAINEGGESPSSNIASVTIPIELPGPPSSITAIALSSTVISIAWNPPDSDGGSPITSYRLEYSTDGSYWRPLAGNVSGTSTGYTHRGLEPGALYHYRAYAVNRAGSSEASPTVEAMTRAEPPGEPKGLSASPVGPTQINLTWLAPDADGGARITGYRIEVSADSRQWAVLATETGLLYSHMELDPATTYYYRVFALNEAGESPASRVATAKTQADVPGKPTNLAATAGSHDRIDLRWAAPGSDGGARITGYMIESSSDDGASWEAVRTNTGTSTTAFTHEDLEPATTYYYRVSAINDVGVGESSEQVHTQTHALPPSAPRDLAATPLTGTQIGLEWRPPKTDGGSDIVEYLLEVSDNEHGDWERLRELEGDVLEYTHRVTPGVTYYYRVFAINEVGQGPASNVASAITDDTPERTERVTEAILPRFAAASIESAVEAISLRVQTVPRGIAGSSNINLANGRSEELRALANGQSVSQTNGRLSIWGAASLIGLNDESAVTWNGDVLNFHGGMDGMLRDNVLVGIGGTRSDGGFTFMDQTGGNDHEGDFAADMTLVTPYLGWIQDRASMWATMGFGRGSMTITDTVAERSSDVTARFIAGGGSTRIAGTRLGALNLMIEGWNGNVDVVGNESSGPTRIEESAYRLRRGRLMLEWQAHQGSTGSYRTEAALRGGARYDRNSLDTGVSGAEFSGIVKLAGPSIRTLAKGRMFFPGGAAYSEWGIQAMIEIRSDEHRGLAMQLAPSYGAAEDGIQRLWSQGVMHGVQRPAQGRLNTTLSFDLPSGITPYWRFGLQDRTRSVFAGFRYAPLEGFSLRSEAVRQDGRNGLSLRGLWHH